MNEEQSAFVTDLTDALAEAKHQLKSTETLLKARGEGSVAEDLASIERTIVDAEISISKKFSAISEVVSSATEKAS